MTNQSEHWHLDKRVPIAAPVAVVLSFTFFACVRLWGQFSFAYGDRYKTYPEILK